MESHLKEFKGDFIKPTNDMKMKGVGGEKQYRCEVCGKCFKQRTYLDRHIRVHTGDKPFGCDICKKTFSQKGSLKQHLKIHDRGPPTTVERPQEQSWPHTLPVSDSTSGEARLPAEEAYMRHQPYSYSELIGLALRNSPEMRCTAQEICQFIIEHFPRYQKGESKTKLENSIRDHLSILPHFVLAGVEYKFGENGVNRQHYYTFRPVNDIIQEYEESCSIFI